MKKHKYSHIPAVEVANGRIVWRPYIRLSDLTEGMRLDRKGRIAPPILLGKDGDDPNAVMRAYLAATETFNGMKAAKTHTLRWIMEQYMSSRQYSQLAASSRKVNQHLLVILDQPLEIDGKPDQLGNLHVLDINKPLFNQIKEGRYQKRLDAGFKGSVQTNREITLISSALSWAVNYISGLGIDNNPLLGFKKLPETPNKRYVTDSEYQQQVVIASEDPKSILPVIFELAYLTAARGIEVLSIKVSDCHAAGIKIHRTKGSKDNIILWSPRLREVYLSALAHHKEHKILPIDPPLLLNRAGDRFTRSGLDSAMQRLKQKMENRGLGDVYWNLHLLKSKAVSDSDDKRIAGHKSEAMRERYNTKTEAHKPAG